MSESSQEKREHLGATLVFENGEFCFDARCWCADVEAGRLMVAGDDGQFVPLEVPEDFEG